MIVKEFERKPATCRTTAAGQAAESTMAHYLRRAFGDEPSVAVFNDLRLEHGEEIAQIDHLVLFREGFVLIESKSVSTKVKVNAREEWMRLVDNFWRGMACPVRQVRRQRKLFRQILEENSDELLGRVLGMKRGWGGYCWREIVAISDRGVITRPDGLFEDVVVKADQVVERVQETMREAGRRSGTVAVVTQSDFFLRLSDAQMERLVAFLLARHRPATEPMAEARDEGASSAGAEPAEAVDVPATALEAADVHVRQADPPAAVSCRHCAGTRLRVEYGRYGYYFKCEDCNGNTAPSLRCGKAGCSRRLRRIDGQPVATCDACHGRWPFPWRDTTAPNA
ncbi:MAG: NERD domain-containing protein [Geminicoccaceae bacterium]|nr:MAG: NERD domain-containing protein [Geminicoccaceae bacterium]